MSIKTLRKRVALVAVSALGVGLLSVAPASAAADLTVTAGTGASGTSTGIVTAASGTTGTTITGSILSTGTLVVVSGADSDGRLVVVTGGRISTCTASTQGSVTLAASGATCSTSANEALTLTITGLTAGTNLVIKSWDDNNTAGAIDTVMTWTVVAPSTVNVFSSGDSSFSTETSATASTNNTDATWSPTGGGTAAATQRNAGVAAYFGYDVDDANDNALSSPVVTATSTGGCLVSAGADSEGTLSTATTTSASSYFRIDQPDDAKPATCTVTISVNGTTASSRTFVFRGELAEIKVTYLERVKAQTSASSLAVYVDALDSAGNSLDNVSVAPDTTYYNVALTAVDTITTAPFSTSASASGGGITCVAKGDFPFQFKSTNASAKVIKSAVSTISCAGDPVNYSAALDKAVYMPGEIATLTITAKGSDGRLTHDSATIGTATTYEMAIAGAYMTAVSAATVTDTFSAGVKKYKFIVGSTEGSYQMQVDLPKWNNTTYSQAAVTVPYSIKSGSTAVSNAEVLAAIVKLIASINKQIRALQKSLKR